MPGVISLSLVTVAEQTCAVAPCRRRALWPRGACSASTGRPAAPPRPAAPVLRVRFRVRIFHRLFDGFSALIDLP